MVGEDVVVTLQPSVTDHTFINYWHDLWTFIVFTKNFLALTSLRMLCLAFVVVTASSWQSIEKDAEIKYIETYRNLAIQEMQMHGIPASIKLAQALVESDAGRSVLATRANNHFGIKCKSWWTGGEYFYADDDLDHTGSLTASCFRIYESAQQSFGDHSTFLKSSERYAPLFSQQTSDYQDWAIGLQSCGYATNPRYSKKLIQVIEHYRLYELDQLVAQE